MKVLLIEDSDTDAYIIEKALHEHVKDAECTRVSSVAAGELQLGKDDFDAVLLDLGLPDSANPADTYARIMRCARDAPIIVSTSLNDHDLARALVHEGAEDCMSKDLIADNPGHVRDAIAFAIERHSALQKTLAEKESAKKDSAEKDAMLSCFMGGYSVADK